MSQHTKQLRQSKKIRIFFFNLTDLNDRSAGTQIGEIKKKKSNFLTLPELLRVLTSSHRNRRVWSVAWSPDGTKLASGSEDKTVKIWNAKTGQCVSTLTGYSDR